MPISWFFSQIDTFILPDLQGSTTTQKSRRNAYYYILMILYFIFTQFMQSKYAFSSFILLLVPIAFLLHPFKSKKNLPLLTIIETLLLSVHPYMLGCSQITAMEDPMVSIFIAAACCLLSLPIKNMIAVGTTHIFILGYTSRNSLQAFATLNDSTAIDTISRYYERSQWVTIMCYLIALLYRLSDKRTIREHESILKQYQFSIRESNEANAGANANYQKTLKLLEESNRKLELALKEKDRLLTSVSHEFRNPLNSLLGHVQLLLEQVLDKNHIQMLETCKSCGEALLSLVNDMLDAGKIISGHLNLAPAPTNIHQLIEKVWKINSAKITQKNLKGHLYVAFNLPKELIMDAQRVMQILLNIIGNAVKFTESGYVKVVVSWGEDNKNERSGSEFALQETLCRSGDKSSAPTLFQLSTSHCQTVGLKRPSMTNPQSPKKGSSFRLNLPVKTFSTLEDTDELGDADSRPLPVFLPTPKFIETTLNRRYIKFEAHEQSVESHMQAMSFRSGSSNYHKGFFKVEVMDTGCGIDDDSKTKLFQAFEQEDVGITRKHGGTGLGLYITRKLADKMKGEIDFKSAKNVGTSFTVSIPCRLIHRHAESSIFLDEKMSSPMEFAGTRALIVEDIEFNQKIMLSYCKKLGIEGYIARNGEEGYNMFKSKQKGFFAFVTMDLQMPKLDGYSCCVLIRKYEKLAYGTNNQVPIAIVTGNCSHHEESACMDKQGEVKAMKFFYKPLAFSEFRDFVASVVGK